MNRKDRRRLKKARRERRDAPRVVDVDAILGRITALLQGGHAGQARGLCQSLLAERPDDARVLNLGAIACFETGDASTAVTLLETAIEHEPRFVDAHNNLGNVLKAEGDLLRAESAYRRAIDIAPSYFDAHFNLGIVLEAMGRPGEGKESYRNALDIQPDYLPAYLNSGSSTRRSNTIGGSSRWIPATWTRSTTWGARSTS